MLYGFALDFKCVRCSISKWGRRKRRKDKWGLKIAAKFWTFYPFPVKLWEGWTRYLSHFCAYLM